MADTLSLDAAVALRHRPRRAGPAHRGQPAARRDRRRRRPARHRHHPRRAAPGRADAVHRPRRRRRLPGPARGRTEALGFYLDHDRVHVGDLATITADVFTAWANDRATGLDALMLAPTRDLVSQLNQRAQAHRLAGRDPGPGVRLADGNTAYVGDTIITRTNDRRLRLGANDWVKNGDRWTVHDVAPRRVPRGAAPPHRPAGDPARRLRRRSAELGYATTIHGAQGISVDTVHGLATGEETRQQLYTMLTRGADANHLYLQVVGDGDPHDLLQPQNVRPPTATEILESILARDDAPVSATTTAREHASPTLRLGAATARYLDALHVAAEHHLGPTAIAHLETGADRIVPGIADDPAWPTLRAHLILLAATGADPLTALHFAASSRELDTADDRAAVLDWRLDDPSTTPAPDHCPGCPASPSSSATTRTGART